MQSTSRKQRVHLSITNLEWEELGKLSAIADVSRSHVARMAIRHIIAHPELILPISPELNKEEEEDRDATR
jgi:hypothetical protein